MLHAVPDLLDALEARLIAGDDPMGLLSSIRWSELVGWPEDREGAQALQRKVASIQALVNGLQAPLRATLMGLAGDRGYGRDGQVAGGPVLAPRMYGRI
ncbi:hypothetical protein GETHPA_15610 [Geothrix rubra]|uniref:Flagellar protein FliT n=1 Tax=Geothrix rubra TaxID=2927977 RepID=A0ABQ5Q5R5_9BACT|nr:hypothetical protein [Geothrix rubra]GLH70028.1 hypothetical protein GETHPA_15610 [Geothrix rubra]